MPVMIENAGDAQSCVSANKLQLQFLKLTVAVQILSAQFIRMVCS